MCLTLAARRCVAEPQLRRTIIKIMRRLESRAPLSGSLEVRHAHQRFLRCRLNRSGIIGGPESIVRWPPYILLDGVYCVVLSERTSSGRVGFQRRPPKRRWVTLAGRRFGATQVRIRFAHPTKGGGRHKPYQETKRSCKRGGLNEGAKNAMLTAAFRLKDVADGRKSSTLSSWAQPVWCARWAARSVSVCQVCARSV